MSDDDYIELGGVEAIRQWKRKEKGDQLYSIALARWLECWDVGQFFSPTFRYRRPTPKPQPTEAEHFI